VDAEQQRRECRRRRGNRAQAPACTPTAESAQLKAKRRIERATGRLSIPVPRPQTICHTLPNERFPTRVSGSEAVVAVRRAGRHRSHYGTIGGKPQPLRAAPADCGIDPALPRSAVFEPRHRSLPLGIRHRDLAGRRWVPVVVEVVAVDYKPAADERNQLKQASTLPSGTPTIFSFCNLASSHWMHSQVFRVPKQKSFLRQQCPGSTAWRAAG
jgi:hypothetical protein